jgi:ribosomal protein S18 acetylase RimI-like enzyme
MSGASAGRARRDARWWLSRFFGHVARRSASAGREALVWRRRQLQRMRRARLHAERGPEARRALRELLERYGGAEDAEDEDDEEEEGEEEDKFFGPHGIYRIESEPVLPAAERARSASVADGCAAARDVLAEFSDLCRFRGRKAGRGEALRARVLMYAKPLPAELSELLCRQLSGSGAGATGSQLRALLERTETRVLVAHEVPSAEPLAMAVFSFSAVGAVGGAPEQAVLVLHALSVVAARRGSGLGSRLVTLLEKVAGYNLMDAVVLRVSAGDAAARAFFHARGFEGETRPELVAAVQGASAADHVVLSMRLQAPRADAEDGASYEGVNQ